MVKFLLFIATILVVNTRAYCQIIVSGIVVDQREMPLPGVTVVENSTQNGVSTSIDGKFSLEVTNSVTILKFTYIGFIPKEVKINKNIYLVVKLKEDCNKDFFDNNKIGIYLTSGIINTPFGAGIKFTPPLHIGSGILVSNFNYQTNFQHKDFLLGNIELKHFISNCDFDIDTGWNHRKALLKNDFFFKTNSFEGKFNIRNINFTAGYSLLNIHKNNINNQYNSSGPLVGIGIITNRPLGISIDGKASFYRSNTEYQLRINREFRWLNPFINFYKLNSFTELSLGVGVDTYYHIKRKKSNHS